MTYNPRQMFNDYLNRGDLVEDERKMRARWAADALARKARRIKRADRLRKERHPIRDRLRYKYGLTHEEIDEYFAEMDRAESAAVEGIQTPE